MALKFVMANQRPHLPDVERLSERVIRVLGGNPGKFTLQGTNTYIIGTGPSRLLIDTGEGQPSWLTNVQSVLSSESCTLSSVILTHWHPDHVGGVSSLLKSGLTPKIFKNNPDEGQENIRDGQIFEVDGATLRAYHCPGHAVDHMALVLEEENAMFTGDNVLGHGTAVFEDLPAYLKSLAGMREQLKGEGRGYPGHGAVIEECKVKIGEYIQHREAREREIVDVLGRGVDGRTEEEGMKVMEMVKVIYKDVPENLHVPASRGVLQVLDKLVEEGRVSYDEEKESWSLSRKAAL